MPFRAMSVLQPRVGLPCKAFATSSAFRNCGQLNAALGCCRPKLAVGPASLYGPVPWACARRLHGCRRSADSQHAGPHAGHKGAQHAACAVKSEEGPHSIPDVAGVEGAEGHVGVSVVHGEPLLGKAGHGGLHMCSLGMPCRAEFTELSRASRQDGMSGSSLEAWPLSGLTQDGPGNQGVKFGCRAPAQAAKPLPMAGGLQVVCNPQRHPSSGSPWNQSRQRRRRGSQQGMGRRLHVPSPLCAASWHVFPHAPKSCPC